MNEISDILPIARRGKGKGESLSPFPFPFPSLAIFSPLPQTESLFISQVMLSPAGYVIRPTAECSYSDPSATKTKLVSVGPKL